jgi:hypothetical protein
MTGVTLLILLCGGTILAVMFLRWLLKGPHDWPWDDWGGEL